MRVSVIRPDELDAGHLSLWRSIQRSDDRLGNPFLSPEFTQAVGRVRASARVAVLADAGEVVGFLPFERRALGVGKPIGSGVSDCQALIAGPRVRWDARDLIRGCGLTTWEFDHLISTQAPFAAHHTQVHASPVIGLEQGYAAYLEGRRRASKKLLPTTRLKARKLEAEAGPLRVDADVTDPEVLRTLLRWKSAQYRRTGAVDRFAVGWITRLVEDLLTVRGPDFSAALSVLHAGDRLVAIHLGLRSSRVLASWFPAYDPDYSRTSPGLHLLLAVAEWAASQGIVQFDLGRGEEEYKQRVKTADLLVAQGAVRRRGPVSAARELSRLPRRLGVRYLTDTPLEPVAQHVLGAVKRARRAVG